MKAKFDYITNESTLLSFKQGDVIKLVAKGNLSDGWLYGELRSSEGYFPAEYVTDMSEVSWESLLIILDSFVSFELFLEIQ